MGTHFYTKPIVTSGLVFNVDAYNTKSYVSGDTSVNDLSIPTNDGTLFNGVGFDTNAWVFDGSDDYIDFAEPDILVNAIAGANKVFSIDMWFLPNAPGDAVFGRINTATTQFDILIYTANPDKIKLDVNGSPSYIIGPDDSTPFGEWSHVILTIDNSGASNDTTLYVNGEYSINTTGATTTINNNSGYRFILGKDSGGLGDYNGNISSFKIYNRVLTPAEVAQNYNVTKWRFE